jgi:hypothetical protein
MGIRYYAYAFEKDQTESALANPRAFIGSDPLADAWGFEPHARVATVTFEQAVPEEKMLYLDKAWRELQALTRPGSAAVPARPAFRMFEGAVTMVGWGWEPWIRVVTPVEVAEIARDLEALADHEAVAFFMKSGMDGDGCEYPVSYLRAAQTFVSGLAARGCGMVYLIG